MIGTIVYSVLLVGVGAGIGWWLHRRSRSEKPAKVDPVLVESMTPPTNAFMIRLMEIMEAQMSNSDLTVEQIVSAMHMGRTTFFLRLKKMTGQNPVEFIRETRLRRGAELLRETDMTVTQVAHAVGMDDSRYFAKCFKQRYRVTPTEFRSQQE